MEFLYEYGLFIAKLATVVIAILVVVGFSFAIAQKEKDDRPKLKVKKINKRFQKYADIINKKVMEKKEYKQFNKQAKKELEARKKQDLQKVYVLEFDGDIKASETFSLTEEVNAILTVANEGDEVLVKVNSGGGMVHAYGLASSQLKRLRDHKIPLTVAIDKVAASGGYMMACVADRIICAPFAIVGSIGVIAQIPNFNRFLKKRDIDVEQITAGEYKRTLTMLGENTKKDRMKFQEDANDVHELFKNFIREHRPSVNVDEVATGEHWHGTQALQRNLVDQIMTSDEFLMTAAKHADIYQIKYKTKAKMIEKFVMGMEAMLNGFYNMFSKSNEGY